MFSNPKDIKTYTLAGHATLTLTSQRTGARYTYRVSQAQDDGGPKELWFVGLLTGPNNETDYAYLGVINGGGFRTTAKSKFAADSVPVRAFAYFWKHVESARMAPDLDVRHSGNCGRCGRKLTVDSSIDDGIGPECKRQMGL